MQQQMYKKNPRKTKQTTVCPLSQLRHATGLTQAQFAARLGMSLSAVKLVESGTGRCSPHMAAKAEFIFGVDRKSLVTGTQAKSFSGHVYTATIYRNWLRMIEVSDEEAEAIGARASSIVVAIIKAAARQQKIFAALAALEEWSWEYAHESKLVSSLKMVVGNDLGPLNNPTYKALTALLEKRLKIDRPQAVPSDSTPPPVEPTPVATHPKKDQKEIVTPAVKPPTSGKKKKPRGRLRRT